MALLQWILVAFIHVFKQHVNAFQCFNNEDRRFECCHPCRKIDSTYPCKIACPKDFFIIIKTEDLKCSQKGIIITFEDSDIDENMQPLCVRRCPERYQNSLEAECQYCDVSCNVTATMEHYDKATGLTIGLSTFALAVSVIITVIIILYCVFKRRRRKRRKTTQRNNNTYDSATIPVIKSNNNEISSNESYTQHGGVTIAIDNAEKEVSNTSKALNKDCSPENSNVSKAGYLSENHYQENNSCEKLCVAELTPEGYGLHRRKDFVSNHESITALDIEKGTFLIQRELLYKL